MDLKYALFEASLCLYSVYKVILNSLSIFEKLKIWGRWVGQNKFEKGTPNGPKTVKLFPAIGLLLHIRWNWLFL